jgi:protein-tyrosine phosphatase
MPNEKNYQALHEDRIFIGGAVDVESMVNEEKCDVIIDLRAEATECAYSEANTRWINVPLKDDSQETGQEQVVLKAIDEVVNAYKNGHKVGIHCAAGKGRTGTIATGVLLKLGLFNSVDEAEQGAKNIRESIKLNPVQKEALNHLFSSSKLSAKEE